MTKKCKENIFMKREDLKAKGYTDEQIDHILDEFHKEQEGLKGQIQKKKCKENFL